MQSAKLGARLESPSSPQMLPREQRELTCVSFWVTCCSDVDEKWKILGARGALAPVWGRVSELVSKKTVSARKDFPFESSVSSFPAFFDAWFSIHFWGDLRSRTLGTLAPKGCPKGGFWEAFPEQFRGWRQMWEWSSRVDASTVFEVLRRQKTDRFLRYFRKGFEGARGWRFLTLLPILGARGDPKRDRFGARKRFFLLSEIWRFFEQMKVGAGGRGLLPES